MYSLGQKLRTHYKDFLPVLYWPEEVNVTSSYADRCLMSAELLTAGLFPPKGPQVWKENLLWQPIPIHYLPRSQDTVSNLIFDNECRLIFIDHSFDLWRHSRYFLDDRYESKM